MIRNVVAAALAATWLSLPVAAEATIVSYVFTATQITNGGPVGPILPTTVSGRFGYDTSVADVDPDPFHGEFVGAAGDFALPGLFEPPAFGPPMIASQVRTDDGLGDIFQWFVAYEVGTDQAIAGIQLEGSTSLLASDALPETPDLSLAETTVAAFSLFFKPADGELSYAIYIIDSLTAVSVPTPASAALLVSGLAGIAGARMRRRDR